jgi:hypothetical protein
VAYLLKYFDVRLRVAEQRFELGNRILEIWAICTFAHAAYRSFTDSARCGQSACTTRFSARAGLTYSLRGTIPVRAARSAAMNFIRISSKSV